MKNRKEYKNYGTFKVTTEGDCEGNFMVCEISKNILNTMYGGDTPEARKEAIRDGYFLEWTKERIKNAFHDGKGTEEDLKRYMNDNKQYCVFVNVYGHSNGESALGSYEHALPNILESI